MIATPRLARHNGLSEPPFSAGRAMPIETVCPHCHKTYRLKDEAEGKKAICQNAECRKPFVVVAKPKVEVPRKKLPKATKVDAEAMAAAAFSEPGEAVPEDDRVIALTCGSCDNKWDVPWSMQGKNVLCPECRARQRVPELKKLKPGDWRDSSGKPSMARVEHLEGVVASQDARGVSGSSLVQSGVVRQEYEPRPKWHYAAVVLVPLVMIGAIAYGVVYTMRTSQEGKQGQLMADGLKELQEGTDPPLPPAEAPLFRAALSIAAGEYAARQNEPDKLKEAVAHFERARQELAAAPANVARDFLFGELAAAVVQLGGSDQEILALTRIRWSPQQTRIRGAVEGKTYNVQEELRSTFTAMNKPEKQCPADARYLAVRKVARQLAKRGQLEVLSDSVLGQGFSAGETGDAMVYIAVETSKETKDVGAVAAVAPIAKSSPTAQAAFDIAEKPQEALEQAKKVGNSPETRLRNLALLAEWSSEPGPIVTAAAEVLASPDVTRKDAGKVSDFTLLRLSAQAGRANLVDKVDAFANKTEKPEAKVLAKAEALHLRLPVSNADKPAEDSLVDVPNDIKDFKAGHAWGRMAIARHNAAISGDSSAAAVSAYDRWGKGTLRPFGLGGHALGLQDREKR